MRNTSQNNKLQIVNVEEKDDVKVLYLDVNEINNKNIADFMTLPGGVSFVLAFISIDSDIDKAGKLLQEALPSDAKFMGDPVDYIIFDGYTDFRDGDGTADDIQIILLDVKSGGARLTKGQQAIAQAIKEGKVRFETLRIDFED